jgi:hypothetical protein
MWTQDFTRVLKDSGLRRVEMATLYGVSRQTIHYWVTVAPPREGSYLERMARVITAALLHAITKKILPFGAVSEDVRARRIASMAKTLQNLKHAPAK